MHDNAIAKIVVDSTFKIHKTYGPGLLETIYEKLLYREIANRGLSVEAQVPVPVFYEEIPLGIGFRADLIVSRKLVVEIKSVEAIALFISSNFERISC